MGSQEEVRESHEQFGAAWALYARCSSAGEVVDTEGFRLANARQPWCLMNAAILTAPVACQAQLAARAHAAVTYFRHESRPWFLVGSQHWLGEDASATLSHLGLSKALTVVGMVAEQLAAPTRPLPTVDTRRITDEQGRCALADLNAAAYDISSAWVRAAVTSVALWHTPLYGYVAYVDGQPVSTAFAVPLHGVLYVGFVATALAHRRHGLAEPVMRRSLEDASRDTGLTRTVLHATADGYPVYLRMGYRPVDEFALYMPR